MHKSDLISIGELAGRTGISVDTIRVWERRYGHPQPVRLPSGHRRYTNDHVRFLRRVAEALARGHRPRNVLGLDDQELDKLLTPLEVPAQPEALITTLLDASRRFDREAVVNTFETEYAGRGMRRFLTDLVVPLLVAAGRAWADGQLEVRHEHFLTEIVEDTVRGLRQRIPVPPDAPCILLGTLSGERHGIGLQVAAVYACLAEVQPRMFGVDIPNQELVEAARECGARAVGISVSLATGGVDNDRILADLRRRLPAETPLVIGGRGARGVRRGPRGIEFLETFDEWERRLRRLRTET